MCVLFFYVLSLRGGGWGWSFEGHGLGLGFRDGALALRMRSNEGNPNTIEHDATIIMHGISLGIMQYGVSGAVNVTR